MDFKVVITRPAIKDLEEITRYVVKDDALHAVQFGNLLVDRALSLGKFPKIGRRIPKFNNETLREISQSPYRIFYRLREAKGRIDLLRFWHAARGWPSL